MTRQIAPADLDPLDVEDRAVRMKLAAGQLEGPQDRHDLLDARNRLQRLSLQLRLIADHADDRARNPLAEMGRETQGRDPIENMVDDLGRGVRLEYNDHQRFPKGREAAATTPEAAGEGARTGSLG